MGEGSPALVFYISTESLPSNKDLLRSAGRAGTSCSFPVLKTRSSPEQCGPGTAAKSRFEDPALSV